MSQPTPKISIITPVYNVERYLPECIESIIAQSFREWELLLVDDGSTDRSGCICDEYAAREARIRVIHKSNTGVSDSRNIALREARADLIGYVDSDDWIDPEMYGLLYDNLTTHNADVSICGFYWEYRDQQIVAQESDSVRKYSGREAMELIFDDKVIKSHPCDKLFRRKVLTEDLPPRYFEDYATVIKWLANARCVVLDTTPCYHYRMRAGSTVHNTDPEKSSIMFRQKSNVSRSLKKR